MIAIIAQISPYKIMAYALCSLKAVERFLVLRYIPYTTFPLYKVCLFGQKLQQADKSISRIYLYIISLRGPYIASSKILARSMVAIVIKWIIYW